MIPVLQWLACVTGLAMNAYTLLDAFWTWRLVRHYDVNGVFRVMSNGQLLDAIGRVALQLLILFPSTIIMLYRPDAPRNWVLVAMTLVVTLKAMNQIRMRDKLRESLLRAAAPDSANDRRGKDASP